MKAKLKHSHENVYCRIGASKIQGAGVFAIRDIPKGVDAFKGDYSKFKKYKIKTVMKGLSPDRRKMYEDFCVFNGEYMWCPENFNHITLGWFLNHSNTPNMAPNKEENSFVALRKIKAGEELTFDYKNYSDK